MQTITQALAVFRFQVAKLDYGGARFIKDKQKIADSFSGGAINPDLGYFTDDHNGRVWIVYRVDQTFFHQRLN